MMKKPPLWRVTRQKQIGLKEGIYTILGAQADLAASFTAGVNRVLRADGKAEIQLAGE